ncbi:MAG TPA: stage II sporulation protein M [Oscillospiraceae bacterium]|nr:stage II sporulation protein M [Oscillospiraceae bacterium]
MRQGRQYSISEHLQENKGMYFLAMIIFTIGIAAGALATRLLTIEQIAELKQIFFNFLDYLTLQEPLNQTMILRRSLLQHGIFLLIIWLSGNLFFGILLAMGCIFYRGFSIGFTVGFLVQQSALPGILFALAAVVPQNIVYVPLTLVAGVFAMSSSLTLLRSRLRKQSLPYGSFMMQYSVLVLILGGCLLVGSLIETMITPVFMRAVASII